MMFLLKNQIQSVVHAKQEHAASSALDRHRTLQAKARTKRLLVSTKGLATFFIAGMVKGAGTSSDSAKSNFSTLIGKQLLGAWFGSSALGDEASEGVDLSE